MKTSRHRRRLILVLLTPVLLSVVVSSLLVLLSLAPQLRHNADLTADVIASQLSQLSAVFVANDDLLALNVLLDEQIASHPIAFAAIYDAQNRLLAQSGERVSGWREVTSDVTWQNESLGRLMLQIDVSEGDTALAATLTLVLLLHAGVAAALIVSVVLFGDLLFFWLMAAPVRVQADAADVPEPEQLSLVPQQATLLMVRARPARFLRPDLQRDIARLYRGEIEKVNDEEFRVRFENEEQVLAALSCGSLFCETFKRNERIRYNLALDIGHPDTWDSMEKKGRYLATLAERGFLMSDNFYRHTSEEMRGRFEITPFTHGMASGEIYQSNDCDDLLKRQAKQLDESSRG